MNTHSAFNGRLAMVALLLAAVGCADESTAPSPNPEPALRISFSDEQPFERDTVQATARVINGTGGEEPPQALTWIVSDTTRAAVDANGRVILRTAGAVQITARVGALQATRTLTAQQLTVEKVTFVSPVMRLATGESMPSAVRVEGRRGRELAGRPVMYAADNPAVASVDATGRVRAVSPGVTTVRASSAGVSGTARVEVLPAAVLHELARMDGTSLPVLVAADSVTWDDAREYHEVWLEAGGFTLTGGATPRYELELRFVEYDVRQVDGRRQMRVRTRQREYDRGLAQYDAQGVLQMTSELVYPLTHSATVGAGGVTVRFRVAGSNDILTLFYRLAL